MDLGTLENETSRSAETFSRGKFVVKTNARYFKAVAGGIKLEFSAQKEAM